MLALSIMGTNAQFVSAAEENSTVVESQDSQEENNIQSSNETIQEDNQENSEDTVSDGQPVDTEAEDNNQKKIEVTGDSKETNQPAILSDSEDDNGIEETDPENGDRANSWRYKDGEPIQQRRRYTEFSTWPTNVAGAVGYGIDVSEHQGKIDWAKAKSAGVDYAIVRCGYGMDQSNQDDKYWYANANACVQNGIPFGTYLYSYADSIERAESEAAHVLRLVKGYDLSYPIYYDLEESSVRNKLSTSQIAEIAQAFCDVIENAGYEVAIYANTDWFTNYLTDSRFDQWDKWVAQYNDTCTYTGEYSMWQCSSQGKVAGITGYTDLNVDLGAGLKQPVRLVVKNGKTYCYQGDTQLFGEQKVDGHWYYFDENKNGEMVQGWYNISVKNGGTKTVYYDTNGWMVYGEKKIDGHWYYFNKITGARISGWCEVPMKSGGNKTVYYDENGWMVYGEKEIDGYKYYFDLVTGARKEGWREISEGQEVYYDENGRMVFGEKKIDGHWYYFDTATGARTSGWREVSVKTGGTKIVYYDENGWMVYGEKKIDGHWYYLNKITGARTSGWREVSVKTGGTKVVYYDTNGWMIYGEKKIDGHWYYFNKVTGARTTGWCKVPVKSGGDKTVYYDENGRMVYGEKEIGGGWYYFDKTTGKMAQNVTINGHYYGKDGKREK